MDPKAPTSEPWRQTPVSHPPSTETAAVHSVSAPMLDIHPGALHPSNPSHFTSGAPLLSSAMTSSAAAAASTLLQPAHVSIRPPASEPAPPEELGLPPISAAKRPFADSSRQDWRLAPPHHTRNAPHSSPAGPQGAQEFYTTQQEPVAQKRPRHPPAAAAIGTQPQGIPYQSSFDAEARHMQARQIFSSEMRPAAMNRGSPPPSIRAAYAAAPDVVGRRVSPPDDSAFLVAADAGARAQCAVDNASGGASLETYKVGISIVRSSKLYANQRRSNRLLPGGSDSTTAACYMIGGTPDSVLNQLLSRVSPCDPREERCKAVERVLKDKTRGAICALNGENPREARADNLAAVRICEVVADILVAFSSRRIMEERMSLYATVTRQESIIKDLRGQVEMLQRERENSQEPPAGNGAHGEMGDPSNKHGDK